MKRYGYLFEEIISFENCKEAIAELFLETKNVRKYGVPYQVNMAYYAHDLSERLQKGDFLSPYKEMVKREGLEKKERHILKPSFYPDQCAHHAIMRVVGKIIMKSSYEWSCANILRRGMSKAYSGVAKAVLRDPENAKYCAKLDIKKCYDSIDQQRLKRVLARKIKDKRVLEDLLYPIIDSVPQGIPMGFYTSIFFAELYFQEMDWFIKHELKVKHYIRYADDIVLIGGDKEILHEQLRRLREFIPERLNVGIKNNYQLFKVKVGSPKDRNPGRYIDFVGAAFGIGYVGVRKRRCLAFMRQSRKIKKKQKGKRKITLHTACSFMSRAGCLTIKNTERLARKYYYSLNIRQIKEVIANALKR